MAEINADREKNGNGEKEEPKQLEEKNEVIQAKAEVVREGDDDYFDADVTQQASPSLSKIASLSSLLIPLIIAIAVCWFMISWLGVSKQDFEGNLAMVSGSIADTNVRIDDILTNFNDLSTSVGTTRDNQATDRQAVQQVQESVATLSQTVQALDESIASAIDGKLDDVITSEELSQGIANLDNKITTELASLKSTVDGHSSQITSLQSENSTTTVIPSSSKVQIDSIGASGGVISIIATSTEPVTVSFRVTFRPLVSIASSANSTDNLLKALDASPPVTVLIGGQLAPEYQYHWNDSQWYITSVSFMTPKTTIDGTVTKQLNYSVDTSGYDMIVEVIDTIEVGSVGGAW